MNRQRQILLDPWVCLIVMVILVGLPVLFLPSFFALGGLVLSLPTIAFVQWVRQVRNGTFRRHRNALRLLDDEHASSSCLDCGYDLAGLGADAPCPECGFTERIAREVLTSPHRGAGSSPRVE